MKLKPKFITHDFDDEQIMVGVGSSNFHGCVRSNATAAFIVNCLKEQTTRETIINTMRQKYDASCEEIAESVDDVIAKLRSINAIAE